MIMFYKLKDAGMKSFVIVLFKDPGGYYIISSRSV